MEEKEMRQNGMYKNFIKGTKYEYEIIDFINSKENYYDWTVHLYKLDKSVGGVGAHNVNKHDPDEIDPNGIIGTYHDDRSIFRPIQYCAAALLRHFIMVDSRYLTIMSALHIEGTIRRIIGDLENTRTGKPLGRLIHQYLKKSTYFQNPKAQNLLEKTLLINEIYRKAKHDLDYDTEDEPLDIKTHLFSYQEAIFFYFSCRIHGLNLMKWMASHNIAPKSYIAPPDISLEEFLTIVKILSYNLQRWDPDLVVNGLNLLLREQEK